MRVESRVPFWIPFALAALLLAVAPAAAQEEPYADLMAEFEEFAEQHMEATGMPGLSVAVMKGDWIWSKGFGWADLENRSPAKPESMYRLASVTKPMTAVAVLELAEQGKLDLDAEIQTYVPYFPQKEHAITARQLLGHLGGVSHYRDYDVEGHFKEHKNTEQAIAVFADFDLVAEPEVEFNYTSYGYNLLGAAVEGAAGTSFGEFMSRQVWGPMGMESTRMDDPYELIANRVRGYRLRNGRLENSEFVDISSRFAAGGTRSSVLDMISFVRGLEAGTVLSAESTRLMLTSLATTDGRYTDYAMGWGVYPLNGRPRATHSGGQAETRTHLTWLPEDGFAIALATNLEGADLQPLQEKLVRLFFDELWNVGAFVADERERAIHSAMTGAFRHGVARRRTMGGAAEITPEVEAAFAGFREATRAKSYESDPEATLETLSTGRHPAGGHAWTTMGSFMAAILTEGDDPPSWSELHRGDAMAFFRSYVERYRADRRRVPRKLRFSTEMEARIQAWADDWQRVWTPELRALVLSEAVDPSELGGTLRSAFSGRTLVPDYSPELVGMAESAFQRGRQAQGLAAAQLALELYPEAENANGLWGVVMLTVGQTGPGMQHLRKAAAADPEGYAGADNLADIAEFFQSTGSLPTARSLLAAAAELHPDSERVRDALAALETEGE